MQKEFINLQQFAEETEQEGNAATNQPEAKTEQPANKAKELKYSDEDVDKLLNEKFAKWQERHQNEVDEAAKLAKMSAQEKAEYERDQLQEEIDKLKEAQTLAEMTATARKMLSSENISVDDDLVAMLVTADAEKTKNAVDSFITLFKNSVKTAVADALKGAAPKVGSSSAVTKEKIMAIKDRNERQQAIRDNLELFKGAN